MSELVLACRNFTPMSHPKGGMGFSISTPQNLIQKASLMQSIVTAASRERPRFRAKLPRKRGDKQ